MGDADTLTIALMFGALVVLGALAYLTWAIVVFAREQARAGAFTLRRRLIGCGALAPTDNPQAPAVLALMATWQSFMRRAARRGWWAFGLAMALVLAAIVAALTTGQPSTPWLSTAAPCALLVGFIGVHTGYLRELERLPPDAPAPPMPTRARAAHPLAAWGYRLLPLGLFLCILTLALYILLATPAGLLTWDAGRAQANSGYIVLVLGELLVGLAASVYLGKQLHAIGPRQLSPDPALSGQADLALRRFIANQQDFAILALFCLGMSALVILSDAGELLTLAPLALLALGFWLHTKGRAALA